MLYSADIIIISYHISFLKTDNLGTDPTNQKTVDGELFFFHHVELY